MNLKTAKNAWEARAYPVPLKGEAAQYMYLLNFTSVVLRE